MKYQTIVADPPWRFDNRTGKGSPEHSRLFRYNTMSLEEICSLGHRVADLSKSGCHLYLWVPTALLQKGLLTLASWGFPHTTNLYWEKVTKDGAPDRSCMGFYYRNVVEPCLMGALDGKRTNLMNEPNIIRAPKGRHSEKPEAFFDLVQRQSDGPYLELFARKKRDGWDSWGNELKSAVLITTDAMAVQTWREVVADCLTAHGGVAHLREIYETSKFSLKVGCSSARGLQWQAQIRRTLQRHFFPEGNGKWRVA